MRTLLLAAWVSCLSVSAFAQTYDPVEVLRNIQYKKLDPGMQFRLTKACEAYLGGNPIVDLSTWFQNLSPEARDASVARLKSSLESERINVLMLFSRPIDRAALVQRGYAVSTVAGDIAAAELTLWQVLELSTWPEVRYIEAARQLRAE